MNGGRQGGAFTFMPDMTMFTQTRLANALMALGVEDAIAGGTDREF
jgi:hypothetical protein